MEEQSQDIIVSLLMIYDTTLLMRVSEHYEIVYKRDQRYI